MKILHIKKRYKILTGIILFIALLLFAAPRAARWYIVKHGHELAGRNLSIEKIRFNYFTGTLLINNLQLFEADGKTVFISFKKLKVNLDYLPLFRNEIFVKYFILEDPYAQVIQNGDVFNFSDLMKSDTTAVVTDTLPQTPLKYTINNINISRGFINYTDQIINHTVSLNSVDLKIPGFTWNSDSTSLGVDFRFVDGGRLFSNLAINQADSTYSVSLKLDSLNLDIIEPYVKSYMHISALHGYLSNDVVIKGDMRSIMRLNVHGINHVYDFQLLDTLNRKIFTFDDLTVDINDIQPDRNIINLKYVELKNPYIYFELIDTVNNWLTLIKPTPAVQADSLKTESDTSAAKGSFTFSDLEISGGSIKFSDKTLRYPFEYAIDNIMLKSTPEQKMPGKISIDISAGLNGTGNMKLNAILNPDDFSDYDLALSVGQFRMQDVDAYFKHYFNYPVTGGRMNFKTENKVRAESLLSTNDVYFRKFTLNKQVPGKKEYNIPLRLALGIMADKDGIIDVKAPVEMKGENVKIGNLRKIIFKVIGNIFVKAALSPVNMISGLFNVDPEALKEIHLPLTNVSPDKKNMESVDVLADVLTQKPGLNIDFVYCIDPEKTADTLAHIMALEDYLRSDKRSGNPTTIPDSILSKFLSGKTGSDSLPANSNLNKLCRNYIGADILKTKIDSMKNSQCRFLGSYMTIDKMIPAGRFNIISVMPDSIRYNESTPSFRIYFDAADE